ncbi:MAG: AAA family ATPase [Candidatus Krumholzibacteria bacterium]
MLTKLKLHNYKTFLNAEFDFKDRHLVIGANNSGKTNLSSAIAFLGATARSELTAAAANWVPGGITEMKNRDFTPAEMEFSCTCELEFESKPCEYTYDLTLKPAPAQQAAAVPQIELRVVHERLIFSGEGFNDVVLLENDGHEAKLFHEKQHGHGQPAHTPKMLSPANATMLSKLHELEGNRRAILFRQFLSCWSYYSLSPLAIRGEHRDDRGGMVVLSANGENLSSVIFQMKNMDDGLYRHVIDHARIVEPDFEAINFIPTPDQGAIPFVALRGNKRVTWRGLSDGTLRCLGLGYIVERGAMMNQVAGVPILTVIEEPENGIHPGQLRRVFDLFEERAPTEQFIFTTHSPYFIDFFDAKRESVTILKRNRDRTEINPAPPVRPEDQTPDRLTLADQYSLGLIE